MRLHLLHGKVLLMLKSLLWRNTKACVNMVDRTIDSSRTKVHIIRFGALEGDITMRLMDPTVITEDAVGESRNKRWF